CPPIFESLKSELGPRLRHWGYISSRCDYLAALATSDVALSTALHEFQGLAILEAAACGAVPLVPDDLAYREIWPEEWRYSGETLVAKMRDRIRHVDRWRRIDPRPVANRFGWHALRARWAQLFEDPRPTTRRGI
ncbi:MAG: hypothetical protein JRE81_16205, partial [Deltaproteobacteria bacterium]|nr:hypothetical protein [Deltaproteobacteria bacterium]